MTANLQAIESQLRARRAEILSDLRDRLHASGESDKLALLNHLEEGVDWASADALAETDIAFLGREMSVLAELDAALARIKDGSYGTCGECGAAIPDARLAAQPSARYCLACQEQLETGGERGVLRRRA